MLLGHLEIMITRTEHLSESKFTCELFLSLLFMDLLVAHLFFLLRNFKSIFLKTLISGFRQL